MFAIDLHAHTRFFHGHEQAAALFDPIGVRLLELGARYRGLDGVALTNHDYYHSFSGQLVQTIPGIEVSSTKGHILVVGPDPPTRTSPGTLTPKEVVELAHERGCAAIVAHPYRNSTVREVDAEFDAIEVNGKHPRTEQWARDLAEQYDLPLVGGSDAHYPIEVGRAYTLVDADTLTPENVVAAIRDGRVKPEVRRGTLDKLVRRGYRKVHQQKENLHRPKEETPGVGEPPKSETNGDD
ncbi:PHP-associated domain-containing protein [Haladaptatus sp. AB643]|uniref:PHP-associated domain-containing protein n=1 Tax=unclassified Haladaptatus TaxID=2622732 RepID=UPI00209C630C|nr:PHP domain-containing protein [Haladaptatus sp. AB643]MCO8252840.1 PHP domain-containing protein [Haladaptatus sp. AB618]